MKETSDDNYLESESYLYLRKEAETILATRKYSMEEMSMDSYHKTIHELRTYQIELELQNEELLHTQTELNKGKARYAFLYENAPIGYLTMNEKGKMLTVNYAVSELLGYLPSQFKNKRLADFITPKDQDSYFLNLQKLLKTTDKQSFEVGMVKGSGLHFWVRLDWVHIKKRR